MLKDCRGLTIIEAVVGVCVASLLLGAVLLLYSSAVKVQTRGVAQQEASHVAQIVANRIINGDAGGAVPLLLASEVVVRQTPSPALAYRVVWQDRSGVSHDDEVTYYLSGTRLLRVVADYTAPLGFATTGGTEIASGVTQFSVTKVERFVRITLTIVANRPDEPYTLTTGVMPRLLPAGG